MELGNLHFVEKTKFMQGNNPFKGNKLFLEEVIVQATKLIKAMLPVDMEYLEDKTMYRNGTLFLKQKGCSSILYAIYATGQLRSFPINAQTGKIHGYCPGTRIRTHNYMSLIKQVIELYNEGEWEQSANRLAEMYAGCLTHLIAKLNKKSK